MRDAKIMQIYEGTNRMVRLFLIRHGCGARFNISRENYSELLAASFNDLFQNESVIPTCQFSLNYRTALCHRRPSCVVVCYCDAEPAHFVLQSRALQSEPFGSTPRARNPT